MDHARVWARLILVETTKNMKKAKKSIYELQRRTKGALLWVEVDISDGDQVDLVSVLLSERKRIEKLVIVGNSTCILQVWSILPGTTLSASPASSNPITLTICAIQAPILHTFSFNINFPHCLWPNNVRILSLTPSEGASGIKLSETLCALSRFTRLERLSINHLFKPENGRAIMDAPSPVLPYLKEADYKTNHFSILQLCWKVDTPKTLTAVVPRHSSNKNLFTCRDFVKIFCTCDFVIVPRYFNKKGPMQLVGSDMQVECVFTEQTISIRIFPTTPNDALRTSFSASWSRRTSIKRKPYQRSRISTLEYFTNVQLSIPDKQFRRVQDASFLNSSFSGATNLELNMSTLHTLLLNKEATDEALFEKLFPKLSRIHLHLTSSWKMSTDDDCNTFRALRSFLEYPWLQLPVSSLGFRGFLRRVLQTFPHGVFLELMAKSKRPSQKSKGKERSRQRQPHDAAAAAVPPLPDDILRAIFLFNASDPDVPTRRRRKTTITCLFVCRLWYNILMDHGQLWGRLIVFKISDAWKESTAYDAVRETRRRAKGSLLWVEVDADPFLKATKPHSSGELPLFSEVVATDQKRIEKIDINFGDILGLLFTWISLASRSRNDQGSLESLKSLAVVLPVESSSETIRCSFRRRICSVLEPIDSLAPVLHTFSCNILSSKLWPTHVRDLSITPYDGLSIITVSETLSTLSTMSYLERLSINHTFKPESSSATLLDLPPSILPNLEEANFKCNYDTLLLLCSRIHPTKNMSVVVPRRIGSNKCDYTRGDFQTISRLCDMLLLPSNQNSPAPEGLECTMTEQTFSFRTFHVQPGQRQESRTTSFSMSWSRRAGVKRKPYIIFGWISPFRNYTHIRLSIPDKHFRRDRNLPFIIDSLSAATTLEIDKSTLFSLFLGKDNRLDFQSIGSGGGTSVSQVFPHLRRILLHPTWSWKMKKDEEQAALQALQVFREQRRDHIVKYVMDMMVPGEKDSVSMGVVLNALEGQEGVEIKLYEMA
ncbi:hypothetical protein CPC08DRAFT_823867 [Agrocybe pediades]|nr:hypothetical protein CPC08DRAFT_823867 [Agrocybe pediades]